MTKPILAVLCLALASGCAGTGGTTPTSPGDTKIKQILATGAMLALDVDAVRQPGATQADKDALQTDVQHAIALVGIDSDAGIEFSRLLTDYAATGNFPPDAWKKALRLFLAWAAQSDPAPVAPVTPAKAPK